MNINIKTIKTGKKEGNCYLIKVSNGFILIITGKKTNAEKLKTELTSLGCYRGELNLIIFTNNDSYNYPQYEILKAFYKTKIAMHILDVELLNDKKSFNLWSTVCNLFKQTGKPHFEPDLIIDEGYSLTEFGLNARVLYLPGYSNSVGILTDDGRLFCEDFIELSNPSSTSSSINKLIKNLENLFVDIIYPSNGDPFSLSGLNI